MASKKTSKKSSTAVAAGLTAAAVAIGGGVGVYTTLSEPTAVVEEQGDFAGAMSDLERAVNDLVDKSDERGMTLPQSPGINDVTTGMGGMAPTKGTTRTVQVATGGDIAKGDYIKVCEEFSQLAGKDFATGGVEIVAITSNGVDGIYCEDRTDYLAAILYTKGGSTYLRVAKIGDNGGVTLSNNLVIVQGTELEIADMAFDHNGQQCFIVYNKDGDGWMSRVAYTAASNRVTLTWSDRWRQGGDPENICMAYDSFSDFACICSTVLPDGSQDESKRYAIVEEMHISATGAVISPTPCVLTAEAYPCLYGINYSTEPSGGGWDIAYTSNWYDDMMARKANGVEGDELTEDDVAAFVIHITYPSKKAGGRGLIVLEHNVEMECHARNYVETVVAGYSSGSTVALDVGATTGELGYVAMTDVVHSVGLGEKNFLFIETYGLQKEGAKPVGYMRSRPEEIYEAPLENISYALMDKECAIGYTVAGTAYVQIHELQRSGAVYGPAIKVADAVTGYAGVVPVSGSMVVHIYVDQDGNGHIAPLQKTRVVDKEAETMAAWAVGTALEGGKAGETIRADLNYWPDEQW